MAQQIRWLLIGLGVLALASGGASIFSQPQHEVLYSAAVLPPNCFASGCLSIYTLTVGNTGRDEEERVSVRLHSEPLTAAILPVTVRNFGKVGRPFQVQDEAGIRTFTMTRLRPGERVALSFTLRFADTAAIPPWNERAIRRG